MAAIEDDPIIDEDEDEDDSDDEDMPELENGEGGDPSKAKQSRSEKKSRKAMQKLGMKPVQGIIRVTVKKSKNILFVIKSPDVFKTSSDNPKSPATYIVFGKAEIEDLSAQATSAAVEQFKAPGAGLDMGSEDAPKIEAVDGDDEVDEDAGDLDENDIELVVKQACVSKAKAIKALKQNDNDVVNAIMALSG
jgi:nascent polypeptide-associated complex subunit alpha